jgi:hypothetical protein
MVGNYSLLDAISVAMDPWTIEHRVFVFETFIQMGSSLVLMQRRFRTRFSVSKHNIEVGEELQSTTGSVRLGTA